MKAYGYILGAGILLSGAALPDDFPLGGLFLENLAAETPADTAAGAIKPSHRAEVEKLLVTLQLEKQSEMFIDQIIQSQISQQPQLAQYKDIVRAFYAKHLGFNAIKEDMIKTYVSEFTESELADITAFYQSPTGQKVIARMPEIAKKGNQLGMERLKANLPELQALIQKEVEKNNPQGSKSDKADSKADAKAAPAKKK